MFSENTALLFVSDLPPIFQFDAPKSLHQKKKPKQKNIIAQLLFSQDL